MRGSAGLSEETSVDGSPRPSFPRACARVVAGASLFLPLGRVAAASACLPLYSELLRLCSRGLESAWTVEGSCPGRAAPLALPSHCPARRLVGLRSCSAPRIANERQSQSHHRFRPVGARAARLELLRGTAPNAGRARAPGVRSERECAGRQADACRGPHGTGLAFARAGACRIGTAHSGRYTGP